MSVRLAAIVSPSSSVAVRKPFSASFYRAMAVLVAASPCALAIATPATFFSRGAPASIMAMMQLHTEAIELEPQAEMVAHPRENPYVFYEEYFEEDDEEEEGPVGGQSEYERLQSVARTIGATVITERMLNHFLGL